METNDAKLTLDLQIQVQPYNEFHTITREYDYKWSKSIIDVEQTEEDETFSFSDYINKIYQPEEIPQWGQQLSVNYDEPLLLQDSIPPSAGIKLDEIETGGIKVTTSVVLQEKVCNIKIEEVPTVVDCILTVDNNEDGKWSSGDEVGGLALTTDFLVESISEEGEVSNENSFECSIDYDGNVDKVPTNKVEISGNGQRTVKFENKLTGTPDEPVIDELLFEYEMSGEFTVNAQGFNVFDKKPDVIGCYNLNFTKKSENPEEIPENVMIEYSNGLESVVKEVDLRALADGYNLFFGHVLDNSHSPSDYYGVTFVPSKEGYYNRLSSENVTSESGLKDAAFVKQLPSLTSSSGMFEGCCLNAAQTKQIINSLHNNKIGGEIQIGVDNQVSLDKDFVDFVNTMIGGIFDITKEFEITTKPDSEGNSKKWKVKLLPKT